MRGKLIFLAVLILVVSAAISSGTFGLSWNIFNPLFAKLQLPKVEAPSFPEKVKVVTEESVVIDVVKRVGPSVVTVGMEKKQAVFDPFQINPFDPFGTLRPQQQQPTEQNIGSGFVVSTDGLVVTNKHVVSDTEAKYKIVTQDGKTYPVQNISRDPSNDLAILKIDPLIGSTIKPVELGDSLKLEVGQFVIAIGTALGEFRNTVTTGVVSGLGRGITAGSAFEGYAERLDNVIQTDAAINPGNSGGPLLNSAGQAIGINVAVAAQGQNIGFALPINVVRDSLNTFQKQGRFTGKAFLGVSYKMVSRDLALLNDVPEGAYVADVSSGSPAEKAGLKKGDIITKMDGASVRESNDLGKIISGKKVGDTVGLTVWADGKERNVSVTLVETPSE